VDRCLTHSDTSSVALVNHALKEVNVALGIAGPVLGALHIEPKHAVRHTNSRGRTIGLKFTSLDVLDVVVSEVINGVVHLLHVEKRTIMS